MTEPNIHILFGTDEFAIAARAEQFHKALGDPTSADMNTARLDARTVSDNDLNNAVNAMPFLSSHRLVILNSPSKRYTGIEGHKKFIAWLENVPPSCVLVVVEPGEIKEKEKASHWLLKWVAKSEGRADAQEYNLPRQREMPGWIVKETQKQGGKIEPQAAVRLAEMVGEDTRQAAQEITKLLTYVNFAHSVGIEDVEAVCIVTAQADVFGMVDALGSGNGKQAQKALHNLIENEDAFQLFGMVVRQFRLLLLAREAINSGGNNQTIAETLGVHPFVAEKLNTQARRFTLESLELVYRRLLRMDEDIKTGVMAIEPALELFVVEMTAKG